MATKTLLTVEQFQQLELPEGRRYELDEGELREMTFPNFRHNTALDNIWAALRAFVKPRKLGRVCTPDSGFLLSRDPDTLRGLDVAFLRADRLSRLDRDSHRFEGAPDLAVEIVSPSDSARDIQKKVKQYLSAGAHTVWIAYPETQEVHVFLHDGSVRRLCAGDTLDEPALLPGFSAAVSDLFMEE